jgi:hypothetical protein
VSAIPPEWCVGCGTKDDLGAGDLWCETCEQDWYMVRRRRPLTVILALVLLVALTGCLHSDISLRSVRMQETCTSFDAAEDREVTACALPLRFEDAVAACESLGEDLLLAPVPDDTLVDIALEVGEVWYVDVPAEWRCPMMTSTGGLERGDCDQALPFACERVIW